MRQVLLVEDSKEICTMVRQSIGSIAELVWAENLTQAREYCSKSQYDLVLLDMELPDGNGIDFCTELQHKSPLTPIFFLTAHKDLSEKVLGFSAGADDYITKPFDLLELKARIEAKLRKVELHQHASDHLNWKEIKINKSSQDVEILSGETYQDIELTALEFKLLMYFANRYNTVISRDDILNDIWGEDVHVYARSVDTHVSKLRKKLDQVSHILESVHGAGYKFCPTEKIN